MELVLELVFAFLILPLLLALAFRFFTALFFLS
jgi:hypothetical protein